MAPEVVQSKDYNQQCDIWSAGIILYLMLSGSLPFQGKTNEDTAAAIIKGSFEFKGKWIIEYRTDMETNLGRS